MGIRAALAGGIALLALATSDALADDMGRARVHAVMNSVFGAGPGARPEASEPLNARTSFAPRAR